MTKKYSPEEIEAQAFAPGWEREEATDYADYLDALLDPTDPLHAAAAGISSDEESPSTEADDPTETPKSVQPVPNERANTNDDPSS